MTTPPFAPSLPAEPLWTCPACPLLCDDLGPQAAVAQCAVASAKLAALPAGPATVRVAGQSVPLAQALATAARWLAESRQPLFGGLGTDVAGARALYPLARAHGAVVDAAAGPALTEALRAQQDRGGYTTTLAEVRERADLIVMVGSWAPLRAPRLLGRVLAGRDSPAALVALACDDAPALAHGLPVAAVPPAGDLFETLATLCALQAGRAVRQPPAALQALCERLRQARYAVLLWEPARLGPQAGLLIERLQHWVGLLNRSGRAAGLALGGGQGASTVQQTWAWLSGLPLRSRSGPHGPEHDPWCFDTERLLADHAVDLLLWVAAFGGTPPAWSGRRIVLGTPALAAELGDERETVFLPVGTPGLDHAGHLFRGDGTVMLPLHPVRQAGLPSVAELLQALQAPPPLQDLAA